MMFFIFFYLPVVYIDIVKKRTHDFTVVHGSVHVLGNYYPHNALRHIILGKSVSREHNFRKNVPLSGKSVLAL